MRSRKAMMESFLGWTLLIIAALVVLIIGYMILRGKGWSAIKFIENLMRIRG